MSIFESKLDSFKEEMERANKQSVSQNGGQLDNRPMTMEEMMKMRDAETSNIKYLDPLTLEEKGIPTYQDKSTSQRLNDFNTADMSLGKQKNFYMSIGSQRIDITVTGAYETYPPVYTLGPGFSLSRDTNAFHMPDDFVFEPTLYFPFKDKVTFHLEYGEDKFEVDYGDMGYMYLAAGRSHDSRYDALGIEYSKSLNFVRFYDKSTSGSKMVFQYNEEKRILEFVEGAYTLTQEQCKVFDGVSVEDMTLTK